MSFGAPIFLGAMCRVVNAYTFVRYAGLQARDHHSSVTHDSHVLCVSEGWRAGSRARIGLSMTLVAHFVWGPWEEASGTISRA